MKNDTKSGSYVSVFSIDINESPVNRQVVKISGANVHKFSIGQSLFYTPSTFETGVPKGYYHVVTLLPSSNGENQYRIKSQSDKHERIVYESQLAFG